MNSVFYIIFADRSGLFAVNGTGLTMDPEIHKL